MFYSNLRLLLVLMFWLFSPQIYVIDSADKKRFEETSIVSLIFSICFFILAIVCDMFLNWFNLGGFGNLIPVLYNNNERQMIKMFLPDLVISIFCHLYSVYTHTCMCACIHTHTHVHIYIYMCVCVFKPRYTHTHTHTHMDTLI